MTAELEKCPFCGVPGSLALCGFGTAQGECFECGSHGPYRSSHEEAIEAWNRRASQPPAPGEVDAGDGHDPVCMAVLKGAPCTCGLDELLATKTTPGFQRAEKIGGSYQATGTIVSAFKTTAGEQRYVFEFDVPKGMLHIFSGAQLQFLTPPTDAAPLPTKD